MKWSIVKMHRDEYRNKHLAVRDYKITFLGIPVCKARFTSTNNDALRKLTVYNEDQVRINGFKK